MSTPSYGNLILLNNLLHREGNSFLEVCGKSPGGHGTLYNVVTNRHARGRGFNEGFWELESASGKMRGEPVLDGDLIHLKNKYLNGSYLEVCGKSPCGHGTLYNVVTNKVKTGRAGREGIWQVEFREKRLGDSTVGWSLPFHLKNMYANGSYLEVCGKSPCGHGTLYDVVTNKVNTGRSGGEGVWRMEIPENYLLIVDVETDFSALGFGVSVEIFNDRDLNWFKREKTVPIVKGTNRIKLFSFSNNQTIQFKFSGIPKEWPDRNRRIPLEFIHGNNAVRFSLAGGRDGDDGYIALGAFEPELIDWE